MTNHDGQGFPSRGHMIYIFHHKICVELKEYIDVYSADLETFREGIGRIRPHFI